jgi:glucosamine-phosphate N-acetyltransferase
MSTPLFDASLIDPTFQKALPENITIRPLFRTDFKLGHLDVLRDLAVVGDIPEEQWVERFDWMKACSGAYYVCVFVEKSDKGERIVATGTLIVEKKL